MKALKLALAMLAGTGTIVLAAGAVTAREAAPAPRPWMDAKLSPDQRADLLLAQMTLDEKIAILHGPMAMPLGPNMPMPKGAVGSAGFIPGNDRLGIPALQESDASLGVTNPMKVRGPGDMSTALPSGLLMASAFDPQMAFAAGQLIGTEARAKGINVMLAGGTNLARDPRNGRNFEYVGEDPLLAGTISGEAVRGIQSQGVISTVKHFALNDQEHKRMTVDSVIAEDAARESDLLAFEIAIETGRPGSVMCSYNLINGVYGCENDQILNRTLKGDWGYPGWVMSDWGAVHGVEAAAGGLDQQSGDQLDKQKWFDQPLREAVTAGKVPQAKVDDMARRVLREMFATGLFDRAAEKGTIDFSAHMKLVQQAAEDGIVLLDNRNNLLPLATSGKRIAVIGGHAEAGVPSGGGSSQVTVPYKTGFADVRAVPTGGEGFMAAWSNVVFHPSAPLAAIRAHAKGAKISFDTGAYLSQAVAAAKAADVAVVFAYQPSAEGDDVPDMSLPYGQDALIEAVAAANPNTVVVLETGNPVRMPWAGKVGAVVQAWYSGNAGGEAIARVLTGEVNPSGRLPLSWPVDESQLPRPVIPGWGQPENTRVAIDYNIEGSDIGYRWYARENKAPRYWFGHGLSYTSFTAANLALKGGSTVTATVDVTNSGRVAGKQVVQLYLVEKPGGPVRRLLAFDKVAVAPGETKKVALTVDPRLLAEFDAAAHQWRIDAGNYRVGTGNDAGSVEQVQTVRLAARRIKP